MTRIWRIVLGLVVDRLAQLGAERTRLETLRALLRSRPCR